jgi:hypothetical protein
MEVVVLLVSWTLVLVAIAIVVQRRNARYLRNLEQKALQLGFSPAGNLQPFEGSDLRGLSVLQCDPGAIFDRVMTGKVSESPAVVCDLICSGQHCRSVNAVTIAAFRAPSGGLPGFRIVARGLVRYMKDAMCQPQLETQRDIGKGLLLQCRDKQSAEAFLTPDKLSRLQACAKRFCIESSSDWVFVYQPCRRMKPKELLSFIGGTSAIADILFSGSAGATTLRPAGIAVGAP